MHGLLCYDILKFLNNAHVLFVLAHVLLDIEDITLEFCGRLQIGSRRVIFGTAWEVSASVFTSSETEALVYPT